MSPLVLLVLIVLVDLLGFSLVMPLLPRFARDYGFSPAQVGLILAAYPMLQLIAAPILGRLSDRYGRRPVLIVSQAGTAISFFILGFSRDFTIMLLARMLDGASGGNVLVAQAYVADITTPENRSRGLGLIGGAFGLGFTLGPLLGGLLMSLPVAEAWQTRVPFLVAAGFSTIAWILVLTRLPESRPRKVKDSSLTDDETWPHVENEREGGLAVLRRTLSSPMIASLVSAGTLITLGFAALEGTFSLYLASRFGFTPGEAAFAFALMGLTTAIVQGGLTRPLVRRFGETRLIPFGMALMIVGFMGLATTDQRSVLALSVILISGGQGMALPSLMGRLSRITPPSDQGTVFGAYSSAQTSARMVNYFGANLLLGRGGTAAPFWEAAALAIVALAFAILSNRLPVPSEDPIKARPKAA